MSSNDEYSSIGVEKSIQYELEWLDKIKELKNDRYLDIKYISLCSKIDSISKYLYPEEKNIFQRFNKTLTEYYTGNEFIIIDLFFFNQAKYLIYDEPKNPYLKENSKAYYKMLNNNELYIQIRNIINSHIDLSLLEKNSKDNCRTVESIKMLLTDLNSVELLKASNYINKFNNAHVLYYILRCALTHDLNSIYVDPAYVYNKGLILEPSSMITPILLDKVLRYILKKWESQMIEGKYKTYTYPGVLGSQISE